MKTSSETGRTRPRSKLTGMNAPPLSLKRIGQVVADSVLDRLSQRDLKPDASAVNTRDLQALPTLPGCVAVPAPPVQGVLRDAIDSIDRALCEHQKTLEELSGRLQPVTQPAGPGTADTSVPVGSPLMSEASIRCFNLAAAIRRNTLQVRDAIDRLEV